MKKTYQNLMLLSVFVLLLVSCSLPKDSFDKNANGWLPNDFNPKTGVLLIEESWPKRQQDIIAAYMKNNYPYQYQFLASEEFEKKTTKKSYTNSNRYALVYTVIYHIFGSDQRYQTPTKLLDYHFVDLVNNKDYPHTNIPSGNASVTFIAIIKKILHDKG